MSLALNTPHLDMRIWQDETLQTWRVALLEGGQETVVSFPDSEALGDFIADALGIELDEEYEAEVGW